MRGPSRAGSASSGCVGVGSRVRGFTLIELLIVMAIIGTLAGIAYPALQSMRLRAQIAHAIGDIKAIEVDVLGYEATHQTTPPDLAAIGRGTLLDPWGNPYRYLSFAHAAGGGGGGGKGGGGKGGGKPTPPPGSRKDRFLVPINTTFDLYSMGPDGASAPPLTAAKSLDDIVRGNDGGYVGPARSY